MSKLPVTTKRKRIGKIYNTLFNYIIDNDSIDKTVTKKEIEKLSKYDIISTSIKIDSQATVCSNFVISVINKLCKLNIPITRSFENYEDYIKLLNKKQLFELQKIEKKLKLNYHKKKIYGIYIFQEILKKFPFKEIKKPIPNSIIVYYGNSFEENLPEHMGFIIDKKRVISKFGIINKIFIHPINSIPENWGNNYKIYEFECKEFKSKLSKYFENIVPEES